MIITWLWNKLRCKIWGHPLGLNHYIATHDITSFFSGGVRTIALLKCSRCKATLGRVRNDS